MATTLLEKRNPSGFTLIEVLIVMSIIGILATLSVPSYKRSTIKAREAVLMEDLYQMRHAIDAFYADNARYPDRLDELIEARYLRSLPRDPFTKRVDTWEVSSPEAGAEEDIPPGMIYDVHSGSERLGLNGHPYSEW